MVVRTRGERTAPARNTARLRGEEMDCVVGVFRKSLVVEVLGEVDLIGSMSGCRGGG